MFSRPYLPAFTVVLGALLLVLTGPLHAGAALESAKISFIQHDVSVADLQLAEQLADGTVQRRDALLNETVNTTQAVITGRKSRGELEFNDGTITRLGQLTSFTFKQGTRDFRLDQGSALFSVPKGQGGTRIQAGAVTAAITGTTLLLQVYSDHVLIYVYEGSVEVSGILIGNGQVLKVSADGATDLQPFDVARGIETAALFTRFIESPSQRDILGAIQPIILAQASGQLPGGTGNADSSSRLASSLAGTDLDDPVLNPSLEKARGQTPPRIFPNDGPNDNSQIILFPQD
jgi:hypothetical protein